MAKLVLFGPDEKHGARPRKGYRSYVFSLVWQEKDAAGKWRNRERSTGFGHREKDQAKRALYEFLAARDDARTGAPVKPERITVARCLSIYTQQHAPHTSDPARIVDCNAALLGFFGESTVGEVTSAACRRYVKQRIATGRKESTAGRELRNLRAALRYCEKEGYLTRAPHVWTPAVGTGSQRWLSRDEVAALIRAARSQPTARTHLPLFILMGVYTGKRRDAYRTLQWQPNTDCCGWVGLDDGVIHWGYSGTKKRRGEPTPIPRQLLTFLRYAHRRGGKYVLDNGMGEPVGSVKRSWSTAIAKAGIEPARIHDMRHTAATVALSRGAKPWKVAKYLGMSLDTLLRVYGHVIPGALDEVKTALETK